MRPELVAAWFTTGRLFLGRSYRHRPGRRGLLQNTGRDGTASSAVRPSERPVGVPEINPRTERTYKTRVGFTAWRTWSHAERCALMGGTISEETPWQTHK